MEPAALSKYKLIGKRSILIYTKLRDSIHTKKNSRKGLCTRN